MSIKEPCFKFVSIKKRIAFLTNKILSAKIHFFLILKHLFKILFIKMHIFQDIFEAVTFKIL